LKNDGNVRFRSISLLRNHIMLPNPRPSLSSVLRRRFDSLKWDVKKCEDIVFDLQVGVSHFTSFGHVAFNIIQTTPNYCCCDNVRSTHCFGGAGQGVEQSCFAVKVHYRYPRWTCILLQSEPHTEHAVDVIVAGQ
jgi:hypothetical protein